MTKELGQRIRAERTARKMTQEELAEKIDVSRQTLSLTYARTYSHPRSPPAMR